MNLSQIINSLSQYADLGIQVILILLLFWVATLFMVLDKKLNSLKSGTDGVKQNLIELNGAIERAQNALLAIKTNTKSANEELEERILEAKRAAETLKFLSTTANAVQMPQKPTLDNQIKTQTPYAMRRKPNFDDLPPIDVEKRNQWGGLR